MTSAVIICTMNRPHELKRCIESIMAQTRLPDEVVIVDASDNERFGIQTETQFSSLGLTIIHSKPGLTHQRNIGIDASHGDIIFFFDDDVILEPTYINLIMDFYEENLDKKIGGVQGVDTLATFSWLAHKKRLFYHRFFFLNHDDQTAELLPSGKCTHLDMWALRTHQIKSPIRVSLLSVGFSSFRRQAFQEFRFDEHYSGYSHGEDVDFSHRVSKKYELYCLPTARLEHHQTPKHIEWYRTKDFWQESIHAQGYLFSKHLSKCLFNYFALLWSWVGLMLLYGVINRNREAIRGIWQGISGILKGDPQRGGLLAND